MFSVNITPAKASPADAKKPALDRTLRIEHDRKRLAFAALASGAGTVAAFGYLVWRLAHPDRIVPEWWAMSSLSLAALVATLGFLRSWYKLLDGDPAIVVSPRGLRFRPSPLSEPALIPWSAIKEFKTQTYKNHRYLKIKVENCSRFVSHPGILGRWRWFIAERVKPDELSFSTPMSKQAWRDFEALLQEYLKHYSQPTPQERRTDHDSSSNDRRMQPARGNANVSDTRANADHAAGAGLAARTADDRRTARRR